MRYSSIIGETLLGVIHGESVGNQSDFVNEGIEIILDRLGIKSDKPLTRKEKLLAFIGFKAGSMWGALVEGQSQTEPASPAPMEVVMMGILKTNGKNANMKKIEKYVVFKYEDEFGFHYMVMDKLPGEGPTRMDHITFEEKINPNCTPGAITHQPFLEDGESAYVLSSRFVPVAGWWPDKGDVLDWQEKARVYRAAKELKKKEEDLKLEKAIDPLREAYSHLSPSGRSTFIAQMIYLLTK